MIEATQEDSVAIGELINLDAKIKELNTQKDELKKQLIFRLKDAQGFTIQGQKVISYKAQSTTRCDTTRLKKESPETFLQFSKTIESRTFRLSA